MIRAIVQPDTAAFTVRLAAKARALAEARAEQRQQGETARWRSPRLLWPLLGER